MADNNLLEFNEISKIPIDFEESVQLLTERIKQRLPNQWSDFLESNVGIVILEAICFESMKMAYLLSRNINEAFLPTARTRDAVMNLVKSISYKPKGPSPASTYCIFTLNFDDDSQRTNSIFLKKYETKLTSIDNKEYYLAEDIEFPVGITSIEAMCRGGIILEDLFIGSGQIRYPYITSSFPVATIEYVLVNGTPWEYSEYMDNLNNKKAYTVEYDNDFRAKISFGNGVYGSIPDAGSEITVGYSVCDGLNSNTGANMITNLATQIYYENEQGIFTPVNISVTNPEPAVGGDDMETVNEVKVNSSSVYRTQWRAVTKQDFYDLLRAERGIYKLAVLDRNDTTGIGITEVKIIIIPTGEAIMNTELKERYLAVLEQRKHITAEVGFLDPTYVPIDVEASLTLKRGVSNTTVKVTATKKIKDYLSYRNRDFGQSIDANEIEDLLKTVPGLERVDNVRINERRYTYLYENFDPVLIKSQILEDIIAKRLEGVIMTEADYEARYRTLKIIDTSRILAVGDNITICRDREIIHRNTIENIDGSIYLLRKPIVNAEGEYIKLLSSDQVYLILNLKEDFLGGTKRFVPNRMVHNLLTHCTVYFEDYNGYTDNTYFAMFTDVDSIILSENVERTITARHTTTNGNIIRGNVLVCGKDYVPRAESNTPAGTYMFNMLQPPRFSIGTTIFHAKFPSTRYYVRDIQGKTIYVQPPLINNVEAYDEFIVDNKVIELQKYEIADVGNIDIIYNQVQS